MVAIMSAQLGPTIRAALSDESAAVRDSAAETFEALHDKLGIQDSVVQYITNFKPNKFKRIQN